MGGGTRRTVTAVFVDVVGSTSIAEQMDPEAFAGLMSRFFSEMSAVVARHGGVVEKFIGDAVKGSFGIPVAHEDDALRAVRAAVEMRDSLAALNEDLRGRWGIELQTRTGINTGAVMSLNQGDQAVVLGDAMNVAARLQQAAGPGEVLIGPTTLQLTAGAVDADPVEPLALKGKTSKFQAYRLVELHPDAAAIPRYLDRPLVGREKELRELVDMSVAARLGSACTLLNVSGDAGIGKSRLLTEAEGVLGAEGFLVLSGGCVPYGEAVTYAPIRQVIATWVETNKAANGDVRAAVRSVVAAADSDVIVNRISQLLNLEEATAPPEEQSWAARKLLEAVARTQPLVVMIEDLHWAEGALLDMLDHVIDWTRDAPLMLACSFRPEFLHQHPEWERRARKTLRLEPLGRDAARTLIQNVWSAVIEPERVDEVTDISGGNPLFIEQMLSMLDEAAAGSGRRGSGGGLEVPPSIQALLRARLDALAAHEREAVEAAAVVGTEFAARDVHELLGEGEVAQVLQALRSLTAKNLVQPDRWETVSGPVFTFRHALIREAAYDALPRRERAERHERLAQWLAAADPPAPPEVVGHHYEQALRSLEQLGSRPRRDLALRAAELLREAGSRAHQRHDMGAAAMLLSRSWHLLRTAGVQDFGLAMMLIEAVMDENDLEQAQRLLSAFQEAGAQGDRRFEAAAILTKAFLRRMDVDATYGIGEAAEDVERAIAILKEAGASEGLGVAYGTLGYVHLVKGRMAAALGAARDLLKVAAELGNRHFEVLAWQTLAWEMITGPTPVDETIPVVRELLRVAEAYDKRALHGRGIMYLATLDAMRLDPRALDLFESGREVMEDLGLHVALGFDAHEVLVPFHRLDRVEGFLRTAAEVLAQKRALGVRASILARLGDVLYMQQQLEECKATTSESRRTASDDDLDVHIRCSVLQAKITARDGNYEIALDTVGAALTSAAGTEWSVLHAEVELAAAEVLWLAGRHEEALELATSAQKRYERKGHRAGVKGAKAFLEQVQRTA